MWRYKEKQFRLRFNFTRLECSRMAAADQTIVAYYQLCGFDLGHTCSLTVGYIVAHTLKNTSGTRSQYLEGFTNTFCT